MPLNEYDLEQINGRIWKMTGLATISTVGRGVDLLISTHNVETSSRTHINLLYIG